MDGYLDYNTHRIEGAAFLSSECNFFCGIESNLYWGIDGYNSPLEYSRGVKND